MKATTATAEPALVGAGQEAAGVHGSQNNVITIARRELRAYFDSLVAYVVIGGSLLGLGMFFFLFQGGGFWQVDRVTMARMFEFMPWALTVLVVPLITMRALAEEKRAGTIELLITLPVTDADVILGKYAAALAMVFILLAATLVYPIAMFVWPWHLGTLDWGPVWAGYLGLFLYAGAGTAIGMLFSSITESQIIAFFLDVLRPRSHPRPRLLRRVPPRHPRRCHVVPELPGALRGLRARAHRHAGDRLLHLGRRHLPPRRLPLSREPEVELSRHGYGKEAACGRRERRPPPRRRGDPRRHQRPVGPGRLQAIDTTRNERYTLSKGSATASSATCRRTCRSTRTSLAGLPKLDAFVRDLRDLLQEYKDASGGHFDYRLIEAKSEDQKKEAKEAGLQEQRMGEASATDEEKGAITQGYMGLVFKYGSEKDVIPGLSPDRSDGLEFWITNKLREIHDKADNLKHKVGVLSGHDEIKLTEANLVPAGPRGKGPRSRRSSPSTSSSTSSCRSTSRGATSPSTRTSTG